jgi:outer membrane protein
MKSKSLFALLLILSPLFGMAQDSNTASENAKQWSLAECVNYALKNNLTIKRGELQVQLSEVNYTQSKMNLLPSANTTASYGYNWGRGLDPVSNQFVSSQRNNVSSLNANGSWTLFNGLRIQNSIRQGNRDVAASGYDLTKTKNDVSVLITNAFVNVVFNKEQVENARLQLASSQQQLDRTRKQVAAGALSRSEELNMEAQVATNELNLINQENALMLSTLQLKQGMQMPASEPFDVLIPELTPEDLILDQNREEVFEIAKGVMPEIKSSQLKIQSSDFAMRASKGNLMPRISVGGSVNTNYSKNSETQFDPVTQTFQDTWKFDQQVKDNLYKSVALQLTIPIFNNYSNRASVQRSTITYEQAKISAKETENTLRQNIETAYNDAIAAAKTYQSSLKQVEARDEAFRMMKQRHDIGAANYVEYQLAENNLFQARTDLARAKYNFIFKKKLLDFYQGKPLEY